MKLVVQVCTLVDVALLVDHSDKSFFLHGHFVAETCALESLAFFLLCPLGLLEVLVEQRLLCACLAVILLVDFERQSLALIPVVCSFAAGARLNETRIVQIIDGWIVLV